MALTYQITSSGFTVYKDSSPIIIQPVSGKTDEEKEIIAKDMISSLQKEDPSVYMPKRPETRQEKQDRINNELLSNQSSLLESMEDQEAVNAELVLSQANIVSKLDDADSVSAELMLAQADLTARMDDNDVANAEILLNQATLIGSIESQEDVLAQILLNQAISSSDSNV